MTDKTVLTVAEIRRLLEDRQIKMVAEKAGVHPNTLHRIKSGKVEDVSMTVATKLTDYFRSTGGSV